VELVDEIHRSWIEFEKYQVRIFFRDIPADNIVLYRSPCNQVPDTNRHFVRRYIMSDHLYRLGVRVSGYRYKGPEATRFSE
jgi:hypothetical protein